MGSTELILRPLRLSDEEAVRAAHATMGLEDFDFALGLDGSSDWASFVEMHDEFSRARLLPPPWVPATFLLAEVDGQLIGRSSIRHRLNEHLRHEGGHIGYGVLPDRRRRGHATEILRQSLVVARSLGIMRILVTCDDDNEGSARTIIGNGGVLENVVEPTDGGKPKRRYWID